MIQSLTPATQAQIATFSLENQGTLATCIYRKSDSTSRTKKLFFFVITFIKAIAGFLCCRALTDWQKARKIVMESKQLSKPDADALLRKLIWLQNDPSPTDSLPETRAKEASFPPTRSEKQKTPPQTPGALTPKKPNYIWTPKTPSKPMNTQASAALLSFYCALPKLDNSSVNDLKFFTMLIEITLGKIAHTKVAETIATFFTNRLSADQEEQLSLLIAAFSQPSETPKPAPLPQTTTVQAVVTDRNTLVQDLVESICWPASVTALLNSILNIEDGPDKTEIIDEASSILTHLFATYTSLQEKHRSLLNERPIDRERLGDWAETFLKRLFPEQDTIAQELVFASPPPTGRRHSR